MSIKYECLNIGSKQPEMLAKYYEAIGIPLYFPFGCYDGFHIGSEKEGYVCVWDENKWGKSTAGYVTLVFKVDDLQKTYESLIEKGISATPLYSLTDVSAKTPYSIIISFYAFVFIFDSKQIVSTCGVLGNISIHLTFSTLYP